MEFSIPIAFLASLVATLVAMPISRRLGVSAGLLDHPHVRKLQVQAVPRTGGIGILVGLLVGTGVLMASAGTVGLPVGRELIAIFIGGVIIHLTGVLDDLLDLPAVGKLLAQMLAVGIVVGQGVVIDRIVLPGILAWELGGFGVPLTAFFLLGFVNAVNLVDGLDGLAGGIVAIGAFMLGLLGVLEGNVLLTALSTILLGSILGFLPFNLSRKRKTFLGDAGSMLLGYMLPVVAIAGSRFSGDSSALIVVLAAAIMPIFDTATTITRRFRNRAGIFRPDSMHVHHRFIRFGLNPQRTVLTIHALTLLSSGVCLAVFVAGTRALLVAAALAGVLVVLQIRGQRRRNLEEDETSFREILFYLLGADNGRGPRLGGELAMVDVIADLTPGPDGPKVESTPAAAAAGGRSAPAGVPEEATVIPITGQRK